MVNPIETFNKIFKTDPQKKIGLIETPWISPKDQGPMPHVFPFIIEAELANPESKKPQFELRKSDGSTITIEMPGKKPELIYLGGRKILIPASHDAKVSEKYKIDQVFELEGKRFKVIKGPQASSDRENYPTALWVESVEI
jgi:hypothetical protein